MWKWLLFVLALLVASVAACSGETITITGEVVDLSGSPVAGARVRAVAEYGPPDEVSVEATTSSNTDGSFSIAGLAPEIHHSWRTGPELGYQLVADTVDGRFGWAPYMGQPGTVRLSADYVHKIALRKLTSIDGRVVTEDSRGVAGALVTAVELAIPEQFFTIGAKTLDLVLPSKSTTSNADGSFRLDGVPENTSVSFHIEKEGLAQKGPEKRYGTTIVMIPGGNIAGRVVDGKGRPLAGATVRVSASGSQPGDPPGLLYMRGFYAGSGEATTGLDGSYVIRGLNVLKYDVSLRGSSELLARAVRNVYVKAGETTQAPDLIALPPTSVSGRVLDADTNEPVKDAVVHVFESTALISGYAQADDLGRYKIAVLPDRVTVSYSGGNKEYLGDSNEKAEAIVPAEGLSGVDVHIKRAEHAKGKVVDENSKPMEGASVKLDSPEPGFYHFATTDAQGQFVIPMPPARIRKYMPKNENWENGEIAVRAVTREKTSGARVASNRDTLRKGDLLVTLHPTRKLTVIVNDANGKPLPGVRVSSNGYGSGNDSGPKTTDQSGRVELEGFCVGDRSSLYVLLKGYHHGNNNIQLPPVGSAQWKDTVEVVMEAGDPPPPFAGNKRLNRTR